MRICSFLAGGTEIAYALGLAESLVGVSHDSDYPAEAKTKPVVTRNIFEGKTSAEINREIIERREKKLPLFQIDEEALKALNPNLIITEEFSVPAGAPWPGVKPLFLAPESLEDVFSGIRSVGSASGALKRATDLIYELRLRAVNIQCRAFRIKTKPRVFFLDWMDPLYVAGRWVPEIVDLVGGVPDNSCAGKESARVSWDDVLKFKPDVLICSPTGYSFARAAEDALFVKRCFYPDLISAFRKQQLYIVDPAYFTRSGPRIIEGIELLAHLLHPDVFEWKGPANVFQRVRL